MRMASRRPFKLFDPRSQRVEDIETEESWGGSHKGKICNNTIRSGVCHLAKQGKDCDNSHSIQEAQKYWKAKFQ